MSDIASLISVFISSFLADTLLPGRSETALFMAIGKFSRYGLIALAMS